MDGRTGRTSTTGRTDRGLTTTMPTTTGLTTERVGDLLVIFVHAFVITKRRKRSAAELCRRREYVIMRDCRENERAPNSGTLASQETPRCTTCSRRGRRLRRPRVGHASAVAVAVSSVVGSSDDVEATQAVVTLCDPISDSHADCRAHARLRPRSVFRPTKK